MPIPPARTTAFILFIRRLPVFSFDIDHGVIAPTVVGLKLTNLTLFDDILFSFGEDSAQEIVARNVKLGPVTRSAKTYDRQSSDVRFLIASCRDGALPDLGNAVFQTNDAAKHKLAEEVRYYLKNGPTGLYIRKQQ